MSTAARCTHSSKRAHRSLRRPRSQIGATNDTMATISEGVSDGDEVVLNLREHLNLMDLARDHAAMTTATCARSPTSIENAKPVESQAPGGEGARGGPNGFGGGRPGAAAGPGGGWRRRTSRWWWRAAGGFGGGGRPDPATIADRIMERTDTDKDGVISPKK